VKKRSVVFLSIGIAALFAARHAVGQVPDYDTAAYCRRIVGDSYSLEKTCRESEEQTKRQLASANAEPRIWQHCSRIVGDSYSLLQTCLNSEGSAKKSLGYGAPQGSGGHMVIVPQR
jgi:hypothetical protein